MVKIMIVRREVSCGVLLFQDRPRRSFLLLLNNERIDLPKGRMEPRESELECALRELEEETGIAAHLVERIVECPERLRYDLPQELRSKLWGGKWIGQDQDWYLCRFLGRDSDVDIATKHPEFREWRWVDPEQLPDLIVPFKRDLYRRLIAEFADFL